MRPWGQNGGGTRRVRPRLAATLIAAVGLLVAMPASAQALTLNNLNAAPAPADRQAGAHKNFNIHMGFTGGQVKELTIGLPPGMVGDPNAAPLCTVTQLDADSCPSNTKVGSVVANATVTVGVIPLTLNVSGDLYNVTAQPGEPARFGIVLRPVKGDLCALLEGLGLPALCDLIPNILPPVILQSGVELRPDFGLNTVIKDPPIPNETSGLPTTINSQDITLFGIAPGTGKPFTRNPTSCDAPHTTSFTAVPYSGSTATGTASFSTTGCENLDFSPAFSATVGGPGQTASGVPTTASTSIDQNLDEAGLRRAVVTVPADFNPNATLLGSPCDLASFQAGTCPASSVVGSAVAGSPLLTQPLSGPVVLVASGGSLPNLGLDLQGQLHLLLQGTIDLNKTVIFGDVPPGLPDIPIAHFALSFPSSPGFLGNGRDLCTPPPPVFHADFTGYNGATTSVDAPATVEGCGPGSATVTKAKCKKKAKKKRKHRAASEAKKKKKSCKKKKRNKRR
jgi:hypothetical protein